MNFGFKRHTNAEQFVSYLFTSRFPPAADILGIEACAIDTAAKNDKDETGSKRMIVMGMNDTDRAFLRVAYEEALAGYNEGGCPIGSVLAEGDRLIAQGRNQRVQQGDPIAHGEMDCLRKAGRQKSYRAMTLYTSLSPCMMCSGTILQFGIPRLVIGENKTFGGNEDLLRERGVEVIIAQDDECIELMSRFIREKPELWNEDIAEE